MTERKPIICRHSPFFSTNDRPDTKHRGASLGDEYLSPFLVRQLETPMTLIIEQDKALAGAVERFLANTAHGRHYKAVAWRATLDAMTKSWLAERGANRIDAVKANWLEHFIDVQADPEQAEVAVNELFSWAQREALL